MEEEETLGEALGAAIHAPKHREAMAGNGKQWEALGEARGAATHPPKRREAMGW